MMISKFKQSILWTQGKQNDIDNFQTLYAQYVADIKSKYVEMGAIRLSNFMQQLHQYKFPKNPLKAKFIRAFRRLSKMNKFAFRRDEELNPHDIDVSQMTTF